MSVLGLTVLPISAVVGNCISNMYEDRVVVVWAQVTTALGVVAILCYAPRIEYSVYQYAVAAVVIFVATNVLEGVNMSLLSKVNIHFIALQTPRDLSLYNCPRGHVFMRTTKDPNCLHPPLSLKTGLCYRSGPLTPDNGQCKRPGSVVLE